MIHSVKTEAINVLPLLITVQHTKVYTPGGKSDVKFERD